MRNLFLNKNSDINILNKEIIIIAKRFQNNCKKNINIDRKKKRGRYKAFQTIKNMINEMMKKKDGIT